MLCPLTALGILSTDCMTLSADLWRLECGPLYCTSWASLLSSMICQATSSSSLHSFIFAQCILRYAKNWLQYKSPSCVFTGDECCWWATYETRSAAVGQHYLYNTEPQWRQSASWCVETVVWQWPQNRSDWLCHCGWGMKLSLYQPCPIVIK